MSVKYTLQDCIDLATFAHRHQYDKAGEPYINHPKRVLAGVQAQGAPAYVQMAAVLHDVTEDTPFTCSMLIALGVPEAAISIVRLLDRDASEQTFYRWEFVNKNTLAKSTGEPKPYNFEIHTNEYKDARDAFYYTNIRANPGALIVKKADIGDNLQPWRLEYLPVETQQRLRAKYAKALELLN